MKKRDIIKLVKESVQEVKSDAYGSATLTSQGQSIHRAPGVWEFKQPKSFDPDTLALVREMLEVADIHHDELVDDADTDKISSYLDKKTGGTIIKFPHFNGPPNPALFGKETTDQIDRSKAKANAAALKVYTKFKTYIEDYEISDVSPAGVGGNIYLFLIFNDLAKDYTAPKGGTQSSQFEENKNLNEHNQRAQELADSYSVEELQDRLDQIMREMEQEAEPEGGPVADMYADEIQSYEDAIKIIKGDSDKPLTYGQATGQEPLPDGTYLDKKGKKTTVAPNKDAFTKSSKFDKLNEDNKKLLDKIEKKVIQILKKEGGAAGLAPLKKAVDKMDQPKGFSLKSILKKMKNVEKHKNSDYILTPINEQEESDGEIRIELKDLTFDTIKKTFPNNYQKEKFIRPQTDEPYYEDAISFPNLDDSSMEIGDSSALEDYKSKIERFFGNVTVVLKPDGKNWFDKVFIDDDEFNQARDKFIRGKSSAMQKDMDAGKSIDEQAPPAGGGGEGGGTPPPAGGGGAPSPPPSAGGGGTPTDPDARAEQKELLDLERKKFTIKIKYLNRKKAKASAQAAKASSAAIKGIQKQVDQLIQQRGQVGQQNENKIMKTKTLLSDYLNDNKNVNLKSKMNEHRKQARRQMLMEGALKQFFEMFDSGKTDEEIVLDYAQKGVSVPETFVSKARKQYESLSKLKTELEMTEKEFKNSASNIVNNPVTGEADMLDDDKQLASGIIDQE